MWSKIKYYIIIDSDINNEMHPIHYRLKEYQDLATLAQKDVDLLSVGRKIAIFNNLIVDWTNFDHPGYNHLI